MPYFSACPEDPFVDPEDPFADPEDPFADPEDPSTDPEDPIADPSPELDSVGQGFMPKLITWSFEDLDFNYHDIDFVSFNVDDTRAPKALQCSEKLSTSSIHLPQGESYLCPLCEDPKSLKLVTGLRERGKEIAREKEMESRRKDKEKATHQISAKIGKSFVNGLKSRFRKKEKIGDSSVQRSVA